MSIPMNALCIRCHLNRTLDIARPLGSDETLTRLAKELLRLYLDTPDQASSPTLGPATAALLQQLYGLSPDRLRQEKAQSNQFMLEREQRILAHINAAPDPVYAALQFAVLGNYLDFAALRGQVHFDVLESLLQTAGDIALDQDTYHRLLADLEQAQQLLYLTDNAGELVLDKLLAQTLQARFPRLKITFCVRGAPVHNDATREDAAAVGLPFPVIDNGNAVGGTELSLLSREARQAMDGADVILAKGMGNTETLAGCGRNLYYLFLVKCQRFVQYFQRDMMTPLLIRERDRHEKSNAH